MNKIKILYKRFRYRKQLKQGFGLLAEHREKVFFVNGVDPLKRIDLTSPDLKSKATVTFTRYAVLKDTNEDTSRP